MLTRVLQEYGKLEKTIFILRYIQDPVFRLDINLQLNKGEQVHDLRQFIHFANDGKIRSHLEEEQVNEASCLNMVVNAIIIWNTVYMQAVIEQLRKEGYQINDYDLRHLWPARYEHINPYGHITFNVQQELQRKGLRLKLAEALLMGNSRCDTELARLTRLVDQRCKILLGREVLEFIDKNTELMSLPLSAISHRMEKLAD